MDYAICLTQNSQGFNKEYEEDSRGQGIEGSMDLMNILRKLEPMNPCLRLPTGRQGLRNTE
jgi:hypothetical protein